jgi:hypothetical protein
MKIMGIIKLFLAIMLALCTLGCTGQSSGSKTFYEGLRRDNINNKWGFIDEQGKVVIPHEYESAGNFSEGLAAVMREGKWGFIDKTGKIIIVPQYGFVDDFHEGYAVATQGEWMASKKGYINKQGKIVISFEYEQANGFSSNRAVVKLNGKWGCINTEGVLVVPCIYDGLSDFSDEGVAKAFYGADPRERQYIFIDKQGNEVREPPADNRDITKEQALELVFSLPEVRKIKNASVVSNGISEDGSYYRIQAGNNMETHFATRYHFYVYVKPQVEIRYYDIFNDEEMSLDEWRKKL